LYGSKGDIKKGEVMKEPVIIGVGGPVGSGKTLLIERVTRMMANDYKIAVITNDIYTKEDAMFMVKNSVLPEDRIIGVETGGCPHTAIREDASMNFAAIDELKSRFDDLDIIFLESGGDNLAATFSPDLVDFSIYIIDVAQGEKIPRKAGQGMIKSDMFIINKIDLAPYVGANLDVMREDTKVFRKEKDFIFTNLKTDEGVNRVIDWIKSNCLLEGLK
jgi:urease accessory protein